MQVEQRGAGGGERQPGRQTLEPAGDEQPHDRVGDHVQEGRHEQRPQRREQHRPAADLVGDPAREDERGEHAEGVRAVDEREHRRGEVPQLAVDAVERRRRDRREQRQSDH
jgi:hypothetical protein